MYKKTYQYKWDIYLRSKPAEFWLYIADTNKFNRDIQLPEVQIVTDAFLTNARKRLRFRKYGIVVEWIEEPFEWIYPHTYRVIRNYIKGPLSQVVIEVILAAYKHGTHLSYKTTIIPKNILGNFTAIIQIGLMTKSQILLVLIRYDEQIQKSLTKNSNPIQMSSNSRKRLELLAQELVDLKLDSVLVGKLVRFIETGDSLELGRIRPYKLADEWGSSRRQVLELCLHATRKGMLEFQWQLICPMCRGVKATSASLSGVTASSHCDTCQLDFKTEFDKSVELTFRPNHNIRAVEFSIYCMAGPGVTPHIYCQQKLRPLESRTVSPLLQIGLYRVRKFGEKYGMRLKVEKTGIKNINLQNNSQKDNLFIIESMEWSDQAATASDVTTLQVFRDLFAKEALRPDEQITVGSMTIVFTDLKGSTGLYQKIGDAVAFGLVLDHFEILKSVITHEGGSIVKTIGDAVMAVFQHPVSALKAILQAGESLSEPIILKSGIHYGPCIAVNLNDRLDYFGSTVNLAARLESLSTGQDLVVSDRIIKDPGVLEFLQKTKKIKTTPFTTRIKGFAQQEYKLWRVEKY